jgi:uncharacterized membrane protein YidH (DUF202 family)
MPELSESEQIAVMQYLVEASVGSSRQSAERSYMNAERNLSTMIHTAVMLMILGLAVDRYQWSAQHPPLYGQLIAHTLTSLSGAALIGLGALMTLIGGLRFVPYVVAYRKNMQLRLGFGMFLPSICAVILSGFGAFLLIALFLPM